MNVFSALAALAARPEASAEFLSAALSELDLADVSEYSAPAHLARTVAAHSSASPEDLLHLARFPLTRECVAKNPAAPVGVLLELLDTRDAHLLVTVLRSRVWPGEVTAWVRARMRCSSELSRILLVCVLENLGSSPALVEEALSLALVHPSWGEASDVEGSISLTSALRERLRFEGPSQERWACALTDGDALRTLLVSAVLSDDARVRCWSLGVSRVQAVSDEVFWRSHSRDVLPPLASELVPVLQWALHPGTSVEGLRGEALELLRSHDLCSSPYRDTFVLALERARVSSTEALLVEAASDDLSVLRSLGERRSLPFEVALLLVGSRFLPTDLALEFTSRHLMHERGLRALEVRSWDRAFTVGYFTRAPGHLGRYPIDAGLGLEVLESLSLRARGGRFDSQLVPSYLGIVPVERWGDLSWVLVQSALPYSPELAQEVLRLFTGEFPDASGWEVLTRLVVECPEFPGTLRQLASSATALSA